MKIKDLTNEELIQHLANAMHTGAVCLGHTKAEMNERNEILLRAEVKSRGLDIPGVKDLYARGQFNGPGSA